MRDWQNLILRACAARTPEGLSRTHCHLAGEGEPRVNLSAQQHRALNVVAALLWTGRLRGNWDLTDGKRRRDAQQCGTPITPWPRAEASSRLIVVGAGAAGWTAAVAAACNGVHVTLIDEHLEPVSAQRAASHRYIHPSLYDWPTPGCWNGEAGLAFCNWRPSRGPRGIDPVTADHVRRQIVASGLVDLDRLGGLDAGSLRFMAQHAVLDVAVDGSSDPDAPTPVVTVCPFAELASATQPIGPAALPTRHCTADIVLLATGFLPERRPKSKPGHLTHPAAAAHRRAATGEAPSPIPPRSTS